MTDKPTPTDEELNTILCAHWPAFAAQSTLVKIWVRDAVQDAIDKWGQPAQAAEPVAPDFFTVCAWHEGGGESGLVPLPGYSNETEHGVRHLVLEAARKEGYKGTAAGRLLELGWEIRPVYLTPQPAQTQAGAAPECLTCSDRGAVGNILTAEPCPDCTRWNVQPAPATQQPEGEPMTDEQVRAMLNKHRQGDQHDTE